MHGQLELMTMSWTNTDHREDLPRSSLRNRSKKGCCVYPGSD